MSDAATATPETPKKSKKKLLAIIAAVLVLILGTNHFAFKVGYASVDVAVTDSTVVVTPVVNPTVVPADTIKNDTLRK